MRMNKIVDLESAEIVAAETVVTRHLKIVDGRGNVRIEATVRGDDDSKEAGPRISLFGGGGSREAIVLSVADGYDGDPDFVQLWIAGGDDQAISLWVGGMKGPALDLQGPRRRNRDGARLELLAENGAGFVAAHKGTTRTIMQLTPGEDPETFVEGALDEPEEAAS